MLCSCEIKSLPKKLLANLPMIPKYFLTNNIDEIRDYLFPPQICGGRTPLPPSIGSSSAPAYLLSVHYCAVVAAAIAVTIATTAAVAVTMAAITDTIAATAAIAVVHHRPRYGLL
jgi:hypothetical protein